MRAKTLTYRNIDRVQEQVQVYGDTAVVTGRAHIDVVVGGAPAGETARARAPATSRLSWAGLSCRPSNCTSAS